jgi:hypothetical protein
MIRFPLGLSLALVAIAMAMVPVAATDVMPDFVEGNPSCTDLGYGFGYKIDPPNPGTYSIDSFGMVTFTSDGTYFDWTSTVGVDAVIVKGGPNSNLYKYDEALEDTGLHSPINPNDHRPYELTYELSHIEFCFDYNLDVTKTAETSVRRTFFWTIAKSVTPATWDLFTGDSGTSDYTVTVTKGAVDETDWAVSGTITIENNTPLDATIESVTDVLSGVGPVVVDCGVAFPYVLASGGTLTCTYSLDLPDALDRTNTATVLTSGPVDGDSATAEVLFGAATFVDEGITVDDDMAGGLGTFSDTGSATYSRTFTCDADAGTHVNTATIVETDQTANASVTVNCYSLNVTKTVLTSFSRTWGWTIDKSADQTDLVLAEGEQFPVNYQVTVDVAATDSEFAVTGNIVISNVGNPLPAEIASVADLVSPDIAADVDCGGLLPPYVIPAGGFLQCDYEAQLPDGSDRTNTATATLQNYNYDSGGTPMPGATTDFAGSAAVTFNLSSPDEGFFVSECVNVYDSHFGLLGTVCPGQEPLTFSYSLWFGAHPDADVVLVCGPNTHVNTATFVGQVSGATGSDSWTVNAFVTCGGGGGGGGGEGCSLTPGYWKTHSMYGPARFDDAWNLLLPAGQDTAFFVSGQSYYEVLWTEPEGNAYYILAHAYIAAELNQLNGASLPPDVVSAFNQATALLATYTPAQVALMPSDDPTRQLFISLAGILDDYNNGLTGPGHCSE